MKNINWWHIYNNWFCFCNDQLVLLYIVISAGVIIISKFILHEENYTYLLILHDNKSEPIPPIWFMKSISQLLVKKFKIWWTPSPLTYFLWKNDAVCQYATIFLLGDYLSYYLFMKGHVTNIHCNAEFMNIDQRIQ